MWKILVQKLITGRLSTGTSRLLFHWLRRFPRGAVEIEQQTSTEHFLSEVRQRRRDPKTEARLSRSVPWEPRERSIPIPKTVVDNHEKTRR